MVMRASLNYLIFLLLLVTCSITNGEYSPINLLPRNDDIEGWKRDPARTQQAWDQNSLYAVINGGAELYIQYGFEEGAFIWYTNTLKAYQIEAQLYRQDTKDNAKQLYNNLPGGSFSTIDDSTRISYGFGNILLECYCDRHFIRLTASPVSTELREEARIVLLAFVDAIRKAIPEE